MIKSPINKKRYEFIEGNKTMDPIYTKMEV